MRLLLLVSLLGLAVALPYHLDLGGTWNLKNKNGSISIQGQVPGDVFGDLLRSKTLKQDPYYRSNDVNYRWVGLDNWTYSRSFVAPTAWTGYKQVLQIAGLDTVAEVKINGQQVLSADNMFAKYAVDITTAVKIGQSNTIEVAFSSAVPYAKAKHDAYPYPVDATDPPLDVSNGLPYRNFIRKEQSSFSWDWGPAFVPQGIWMPIGIVASRSAYLDYVVPTTSPMSTPGSFNLTVKAVVRHLSSSPAQYRLAVTLSNGLGKAYRDFSLNPGENVLTVSLIVNRPELWWPRGYGGQTRYDLTTQLSQSSSIVDSVNKKIGFRTVRLVTDPIPGQPGDNWMYFEVNGLPIWTKGSNWIPSDSFESRVNEANLRDLLQSSADANMNLIRVWGGGIYQRDAFYDICDELGLMVWQEFMFACAMYPRDRAFLDSVTREVTHQVRRLAFHPSLIMWSGNNENEVALGWGSITPKNRDLYIVDYSVLYYDTIYTAMTAEDKSRPFWPSSPSNGFTSMEPLTGIWGDGGGVHQGDTHFYNYNMVCTDVNNFPKTKFASEFGFQSHESVYSYRPYMEDADFSRRSKQMEHRQHHPSGTQELENQVKAHFVLGKEATGEAAFLEWSYLTQCMQSICLKAQVEFYRRGKATQAKTMGSIYWQLNSIWPAPTWSSLEYGGRWKMLHYYVKNFYADVLVSAFEDPKDKLNVHLTSDLNKKVTASIDYWLWSWEGTLITKWTGQASLDPLQSKEIYTQSIPALLGGAKRNERYLTFNFTTSEGVKGRNDFYFTELKEVSLKPTNLSINSVVIKSSKEATFVVTANSPAPYVWLHTDLKGRFDDNGFTLLPSHPRSVTFISQTPLTNAKDFQAALRVMSLQNTIHQ